MEKKNIVPLVLGVAPLNLSFEPDPSPDSTAATPYPIPTVGEDMVVSPPPNFPTFKTNGDEYYTVTANANRNLCSKERCKFMRAAVKKTTNTG